MRFDFSVEEDSFKREVRRFADDVLAPHYQNDDQTGHMADGLIEAMAGIGLTGLRIPENYGGQSAGAVIAGIAAEEVGRANFNASYAIINSALIGDIIVRSATPDQQNAWLPPIAAGDVMPALCVTEPEHGTDSAGIDLTAKPDGNAWRLVGEKTSITWGMTASKGIVLARTAGRGAGGVSAFYVDLDDAFLTRSKFDYLGARPIGRASLHFDGLPAPPESMIGEPGGGFVSVMRGFDYSRAIIGLACIGAAQACLDETFRWTRDRQAFGQPISKFQGVSFPLVEAATHLRGARHVCYEALWRKDCALDHSAEAAMAKLWAPQLASRVIHQCLLTFGHVAYSTDSPIGQRLRDVIGLEIGDGTAQASSLVIARHLLGRDAAP